MDEFSELLSPSKISSPRKLRFTLLNVEITIITFYVSVVEKDFYSNKKHNFPENFQYTGSIPGVGLFYVQFRENKILDNLTKKAYVEQ